MEGKIESGKFYVCKYPIGIGGVLTFVVKTITSPFEKANGILYVEVISPLGYIYDHLNIDCFHREASIEEIELFRQGNGVIG